MDREQDRRQADRDLRDNRRVLVWVCVLVALLVVAAAGLSYFVRREARASAMAAPVPALALASAVG